MKMTWDDWKAYEKAKREKIKTYLLVKSPQLNLNMKISRVR